MTDPHPDVARQLAGVALRPGVPLVVCDADEVLFDFMTGFEAFLEAIDVYFTWREYRLNGNLLRRADDSPLEAAEVKATVARFFALNTEELAPVAGAAEAVARLALKAQIVVVSNLPLECRDARLRAMARLGLNCPLVANLGAKGPVVRALALRVQAPSYFIDDSPSHHADVASLAEDVMRIHFVGHARLAGLIGAAPASHVRAADWPDIVAIIERDLARRGA